MAHREFRDTAGREWAVWSVNPEYAERRGDEGDHSTQPKVERRGHREYRVPISGTFLHGWLCFETKGEKRRLAPVPDAWANLSDEELLALCATAAKVAHPSRRLVE